MATLKVQLRAPAADDGSTTLRNRHCERRVGNVRMGEAIPLLQPAHDVTHKRINVNGEELDLVAAFHRLNADYYRVFAFHSKGIASALLRAMASRAPRNDAHGVELQVTADDGSTTLSRLMVRSRRPRVDRRGYVRAQWLDGIGDNF